MAMTSENIRIIIPPIIAGAISLYLTLLGCNTGIANETMVTNNPNKTPKIPNTKTTILTIFSPVWDNLERCK